MLSENYFFIYITLVYLTYHYGLDAQRWQNHMSATSAVWLQLIGGGLLLLGGSLLGMHLFFDSPLSAFGLGFSQWPLSLSSALILMLILGPLLFKASKQPTQQALYPLIRDSRWKKSTLVKYLLAWAFYLLGYEVFFRGLVLFGLLHYHPLDIGISIMVAIYVLAHLNKSAGETIGCIPLGYFWGYLTHFTGSIFHVVLVHIFIACTSQYFGFKHHPEMGWADETDENAATL